MNASGAKAAALHLRYIERDGVEKDGSKGVLYDADGPARAKAFEQPRPGEKHQFRLIVSPEDAGELDLTVYVRRLMATVERDVGRKLEWAAVNHHDTDHPHAHIVIRGVDRDARSAGPRVPSSGLRWRAQNLLPRLGPRAGVCRTFHEVKGVLPRSTAAR
jgi:type IV secretory pathway VirD2 relaxase